MILFPSVEQNSFLQAWLQKRIPEANVGPEVQCLGIYRSDKLIAVAGFTNYRSVDIEILLAADHPRWATKQVFAWILGYPFLQLKTQRCSALALKSNKRVRKLLLGSGFREEGRHLHAAKNLETMMSYGITRVDYLKRYGHLIGPAIEERSHG